jgi:spermidine/putrescine transport system substrate-binding protein
MCVPKGSQNKELAELFINFMLEPEIAIANAEYICYASPHTGVFNDEGYIEYMTEEIHPDAIDILYNDFEKDFAKEGFIALDRDTQQYANDLWDELKISNKTSDYVYVLSAIIAATIVFMIVFFAIRKRIREKTY